MRFAKFNGASLNKFHIEEVIFCKKREAWGKFINVDLFFLGGLDIFGVLLFFFGSFPKRKEAKEKRK